MNPDQQAQPENDRPVAYDANGQPLYSHPQAAVDVPVETKPQIVHMTRPTDPEKPVISDATKLKHERSKQIFPKLNLSEGEYVINAVKRHPIGLFVPLALAAILDIPAIVALFNFNVVIESLKSGGSTIQPQTLVLSLVLFIALVSFVAYVAYFVYSSNRFYLTNESVIQEIQTGLFAKHEQTVSLSNIEDASYEQTGILQQTLDYGSIRLSTEGDETTYRFSFVSNPKQHIATLNNAVEAFKNGRPVETS